MKVRHTCAGGVKRLAVRAVLGAAAAGLVMVATPGSASATTTGIGTVPTNTITPILECITKGTDGSLTALLGYTNASKSTQTLKVGTLNQLAPSRANGSQPTSFQPGTHHGVFSVKLSKSEYMGGDYWYVDGNFAYFGWAWTQNGPFCSAATELPATGNGTGIAIALLVAGAVGVLVVHGVVRRAGRPAAEPVAAGPVAAGPAGAEALDA
jgi:hypothetical protein